MIKVTVQKNLIGLEDLLIGVGTVEQNRGPSGTEPVTITEINGANLPYDGSFSMSEKIDALQLQMDTLPEVVDEFGNLLTGLIDTSALDLDLAGRIWRKEIDATHAEIYYGTELMYEYNPASGNIYIPGGTDYVAADVVVTAAFEAADTLLQSDINALDIATTDVQNLGPGITVNDLVQLEDIGGGTPGLPAVDGSQLTGITPSGLVPIGAIVWVAYVTPDANWLECDGTAISRTTYADLFLKIGTTFGIGDGSTTFNLPDLRGEFIRGWDNSRGIDISRTFGSAQSDAFGSHTHDMTLLSLVGDDIGGIGYQGWGGDNVSKGNRTNTTAASGSTETRPRNVALMAQIKVL